MRMVSDDLDQMVDRVGWLKPVDYAIFEFYESFQDPDDVALTGRVISYNVGYQRGYVNQRLNSLTDAGLLTRVDEGIYELSSTGSRFVTGSATVKEIAALDPSDS